MEFRSWLEQDETQLQEETHFIEEIKQFVLRSIRVEQGVLSFSFPHYQDVASYEPEPRILPFQKAQPQPMALTAWRLYPGSLAEVTRPGWKGGVVTQAIAPAIAHWTPKQRSSFEAAYAKGRKSLPSVIGREMGLLFEIKVFLYLVNVKGLKAIGSYQQNWAVQEEKKLEYQIIRKLRNAGVASSVIEFITIHAASPQYGLAEMIYQRSVGMIQGCKVDTIEFTGGGPGMYSHGYSKKLRQDTADIRIGCDTFMPDDEDRHDIGWSLKFVSEVQLDLRSFSGKKMIKILAGDKASAKLASILNNPLYEDHEKREAVMKALAVGLKRNFTNQPQKFAELLGLLVTGGADTLPAYRNVAVGTYVTEPGWSGAIQKDFAPGEELAARTPMGMAASVTVNAKKTYISLQYMLPNKVLPKVERGNSFGTTMQFEPNQDGSRVDITVNNLVSKGGRGY